MIKERLEKLKHLEHKEVYLLVGFIILALVLILIKNIIKNTYAYYNYETDPVPIFTSKVGNFSGKGDTSPLTDRTTDVNLMFYVQDLMSTSGYYIAPSTPVLMSGYTLNEKKSNCIPTDATYEKYLEKDYTISDDGTVTVKVSQSKPNQVVCRIYYDLTSAANDILVYALVQNDSGTIKHNDKTYAFESELPISGYTDYECKNKDTFTFINYDTSNGFSFKTKGPNVCYVYFNKS